MPIELEDRVHARDYDQIYLPFLLFAFAVLYVEFFDSMQTENAFYHVFELLVLIPIGLTGMLIEMVLGIKLKSPSRDNPLG